MCVDQIVRKPARLARHLHHLSTALRRTGWIAAATLIAATGIWLLHTSVATALPGAAQIPAHRQVFVPYWPADGPYPSYSIFWLGKVDPAHNYADVRLIYDDAGLKVTIHIVDRRLWYDETPSASDLTGWDAISLYLDRGDDPGSAPASTSYRFAGQLMVSTDDAARQTVSQGDGASWTPVSLPVDIWGTWRGDGPNDDSDDKGWQIDYVIPFSALGLSGPPTAGATWRIAVTVHDRDGMPGAAIPDTVWPETMDSNTPESWGLMTFGLPSHAAAGSQPTQRVTIRQGVDGAHVPDAHVGGHTTCGDGIDHWSEWGEQNYAGYNQINIQNQWDVSDYPCFSKYYVTFPLEHLPANTQIVSATLTMYLFGNAGYEPGQAPPSSIHAFAIAEEWDESTINWNNAPRPARNLSMAWVTPVDFSAEWPGIPYTWEVSSAAADAFAAGEPLRLALYSTEGEYHSGKYFWSSDADEAGRPKLDVYLADSTAVSLAVDPAVQIIQPGSTAQVLIAVTVGAGLTEAVQLEVGSSPAPGLVWALDEPTEFHPPGGQTTLTITDTRQEQPTGLAQSYTIPITAVTSTTRQMAEVRLLVAEKRFFLPLVRAE